MSTRSTFAAAVKRHGAELVIVFVGVYAAFWVDNYRDQQNRDARTAQIIVALKADLTDYVVVGTRYNEDIATNVGAWNEARAKGEKPVPYALRIRGSDTPPITVWQAITGSSLVDLIDSNLLFDLGFYYSEMDGVGRKYVRYAEFTEAYVLPGMKRGAEWFYDEAGNLKPEFAAHMDRLLEYHEDSAAMIDWAECLIGRLEDVSRPTPQCRESARQFP